MTRLFIKNKNSDKQFVIQKNGNILSLKRVIAENIIKKMKHSSQKSDELSNDNFKDSEEKFEKKVPFLQNSFHEKENEQIDKNVLNQNIAQSENYFNITEYDFLEDIITEDNNIEDLQDNLSNLTVDDLIENTVILNNGKKISDLVPLNIFEDAAVLIYFIREGKFNRRQNITFDDECFLSSIEDRLIEREEQILQENSAEGDHQTITESNSETNEELNGDLVENDISKEQPLNEINLLNEIKPLNEINSLNEIKPLNEINPLNEIKPLNYNKINTLENDENEELKKLNGVRQKIQFFESSTVNSNENSVSKKQKIKKSYLVDENEQIVRNIRTGEKMIVKKDLLIKKGNKYFITKKKKIETSFFNARHRSIFNRFQTVSMTISFDLIIKTSMILALFFSGNSAMACVLLMISILSFLSTRPSINFTTNGNIFYKIFDVSWSFFASMFIISYDVSVY
ncbi:hypothetical protein M153_12000012487 [Pseudoloma neurophilia]|uniref:Uncharacterized protein n=1 Tax=Pseudoloma neurophilia TaxID=146866 RepID=A0A0R0LZY5_9MICR|nr:hypothetical protein M153_12000012487 [Pseudoloma neurophilia]